MAFLVIGGTGTVGTQVARGLAAKGADVRVMSRTAERAAAAPAGTRGVVGDLRHSAGIDRLFQGVEGVFLCVALAQDETAQGLAAVRAAQEAGVRRIVYMSVHHVDSASHIPHFGSKVPIERAVRESGMAYTILRPNNFYQNDFWFQEAITRQGIYPQPIGGLGISRVDVRDIADAAVAALTEPGHDGAAYPLVGPDVLTGDAVADTWSRHLGRDVRYAGDDLEKWAAMARSTLPEWLVHDFGIMYEHFQRHGLKASADDLAQQAKVLRHPPRTFEAFVSEVAAAWRSRTATG